MKMNNGKLIAAVAVIALMVAGIAVVATADNSEGAEFPSSSPFSFGEVNFGDGYGSTSNVDMNNSLTIYYNSKTGTYTFVGYLAEQDMTDTDSTFYKLWGDEGYPYGIAFIVPTTSDTTTVQVGNGTEVIASDNNEGCMLFLDGSAVTTKTVKVGELTYTFDLSNIQYISLNQLADRDIIKSTDITPDNNGVKTVSLEGDSYLAGTISLTDGQSLVINLNGYDLLSGCRVVSAGTYSTASNIDVTINAGNGGSITCIESIIFAYSTGTLTVNGGSYQSGDYAFIWYAPNNTDGVGKIINPNPSTTKAYFTDANIEGVCGIWLSNGEFSYAEITGCTINASAIGLYLGTFGDGEGEGAVVTDSTINSEETAIEIKSGNVTIDGCTVSSDSFELCTGDIGNSQSGSGVATININNGYVNSGRATSVNVTVNDSTVTNASSSTPVQINAGTISGTLSTGSIDFRSNCITSSEISLYYATGTSATIDVNLTDADGNTTESVVLDEGTAPTTEQAASGNILVVSGTVTAEDTTALTEGTTLVVKAGSTYSGDVTVDSTSTFSVSDGTYTGTVNTGADNSIVLNNVTGNFVIRQGSVAIGGDFDSGTMTVNGQARLIDDVTIASGAKLTIASGATLDLNGYTLTIASGATLANNGAISITSGAIDVSGTVSGNGTIDITGGTYTSNSDATTTTTFVHSRNTMQMAGVQGTFQISRGSVAIGGIDGDASISAGTITITGQARLVSNVTLTGTLVINAGASLSVGDYTLDVSGTTVTNNGTITVGADGTMTIGSTFTNETTGLVEVYGKITGASATNNGTIAVYDDGKCEVTFSGSGTIDMSGVSSDGVLGGTYGTAGSDTDVKFPSDQVITLASDTTLINYMKMTFNGVLIIPEGMTLTISDNALITLSGQTASIVNNGTIIVQTETDSTGLSITDSAKIQNNGNITVQYTPQNEQDASVPNTLLVGKDADDVTSAIINNGTITVGERSAITINGYIVNSADATITLNGEVTSNTNTNTEIFNAGTVDLDVETTGDLTISATAVGATVNVNSVYGTAVQIDDAGIEDEAYANADETNIVRVVGLTIKYYAIGGISVVASTIGGTSNGQDVTYKALDISGAVTGEYMGTETGESIPDADGMGITLAGKVIVSDTFTTADGMSLNIGTSTEPMDLTVSGEMTIVNGTTVGNAVTRSSVTVTGMITSAVTLEGKNLALNAAAYEVITEETSGTNTVKTTTYYYTTLANAIASGAKDITVFGDVNVDADMTIPSGVTVTQSNGTITVAQSATLTVADGGVLANGNVDVEGTLYVETAATGFPNGTAVSEVYSSNGTDARYTNLVAAMDAAQSGDTVTLNPNGNGVTLTLSTFTIKEGVTLDTNGMPLKLEGATLTIDGTLFLNDGTTYTVGSAANGIQSTIVLNGYIKSDAPMTYSATDAKYPAGAYYSTESGAYYWITTVANAAAIIDDVDSSTVDIYGAVDVGDLTVTSENTDPAIVYVRNGATVTGTVTIDNVDVQVISGGKIVGGITDGAGTYSTSADSAYGSTTFSNGESGLTVTGGADKATVTGTVYLEAYSTTGTLTVDGTAISSGSVSVGTLNVNGTFTVSAGNVLNVTGTATVLGTLQTETEGTSNGNATIATMYVGCQSSNDTVTVSGDAVVSGNVRLNNVAYVSSGSTVPESFAGTGYVNTQFMVGGALWITVYGTSATSIDYIEGPVENARFMGWATEADATEAEITSTSATITLGGNNAVLYAVVNERIYDVTVFTDGGISSVAIDDILLLNVDGSNQFDTTGPLTAGEHRLTYTLKTGFQGEATISIDGQTVSGNTFTLSGTPTGDENIQVTIYLTGTEPADTTIVIEGGNNGGSDGLGLTDYLLIILVILIVIMAIMVAMRLMRS